MLGRGGVSNQPWQGSWHSNITVEMVMCKEGGRDGKMEKLEVGKQTTSMFCTALPQLFLYCPDCFCIKYSVTMVINQYLFTGQIGKKVKTTILESPCQTKKSCFCAKTTLKKVKIYCCWWLQGNFINDVKMVTTDTTC